MGGMNAKDTRFQQILNKQIVHNNVNFFHMSKRVNRVKYNSWYTRLEQRNMLSSSQQPTFEQQREGSGTSVNGDENGEEEEVDEVKFEDMKDEDDQVLL